MRSKILLSFLFSVLISIPCKSLLAGQFTGVFEGFYIPVGGQVETMEVGLPAIQEGIQVGIIQPRQQGIFDVILERKDWTGLPPKEKGRITRFIIFEGAIQGVTDTDTFKTNHIMSNYERDAAVYTKNDTIIPLAGDLVCSQGINLMVREILNIEAGIGRFAGIVKGGKIIVEGKIGNCPDSPSFLRNDFQIVDGEGGIEVDPVILIDELEPVLLD